MAVFRRRSPTHRVSGKELSNTATGDHLVDKKSMSEDDLNVLVQNAVNRHIKGLNSSPLVAHSLQMQSPHDKENHPETERFTEEKRYRPKEAFDPVAWREKKTFEEAARNAERSEHVCRLECEGRKVCGIIECQK